MAFSSLGNVVFTFENMPSQYHYKSFITINIANVSPRNNIRAALLGDSLAKAVRFFRKIPITYIKQLRIALDGIIAIKSSRRRFILKKARPIKLNEGIVKQL